MTTLDALIMADREATEWQRIAVSVGYELVLARMLLREKFAELAEARRSNERLREQMKMLMETGR